MQSFPSFVYRAFKRESLSWLQNREPDHNAENDADVLAFLNDIRSFSIRPGSLELISLRQRDWQIHSICSDLPPSTVANSSHALDRKFWRVLKPAKAVYEKETREAHTALLNLYDPSFSPPTPTFPNDVRLPAFLDAQTASEDSHVFKITIKFAFLLGAVERLWCRIVVYDLSLNARVTEEVCFELHDGKNYDTLHAFVYILGEYSLQHLYLVIKLSKVLGGDPNIHIAPYLQPEKYLSTLERHKLLERIEDCESRLGRYRQPLAWGATPLSNDGKMKNIFLIRQRTTMSENHRMLLITEAAKGTIREKAIPATCEAIISYVDEATVKVLKNSGFVYDDVQTMSRFAPLEPSPISFSPRYNQGINGTAMYQELQPFCHPSLRPSFGLSGSGKVAVTKINVLYFYPLRVERMPYRNITVRVQLLCKEAKVLPDIEHGCSELATVRSVVGDDGSLKRYAFTNVSYHHKTPQFDEEFKIALPENITASHHLFFTFYHVHCKRLKERQNQQEYIGYGVLPLLDSCGHILEDTCYTIEIVQPFGKQKLSAGSSNFGLSSDYLLRAKQIKDDCSSLPLFTCNTRLLSSIYSQDACIADFLKPPRNKDLSEISSEADIVEKIVGIQSASTVECRYFSLSIMNRLLSYICFGSKSQRRAAFCSMLAVFEKVAATKERLSQPNHEQNALLDGILRFCLDDDVIVNPFMAQTKHRVRIYESLLSEWMNFLNDRGQNHIDYSETRRLCFKHTRNLLKIALRSLASNLMLDVSGNEDAVATLPSRITPQDSLLMYDLAVCLTKIVVKDESDSITARESINTNIAWFCRGLYLIVQVELPSSIICYYLSTMSQTDYSDPSSVRFILDFLSEVIEFEHLTTVNGFSRISSVLDQRSYGWLYRLLTVILLEMIMKTRDQAQREALRLLQRVFKLNVHDPTKRSQDDQEKIALMYLPTFKDVVRLTNSKGILSSAQNIAGAEEECDLRCRAVLICFVHLICTISADNLALLFNLEAYLTRQSRFTMSACNHTTQTHHTIIEMNWSWIRELQMTLSRIVEVFLVTDLANVLYSRSVTDPELLEDKLYYQNKARSSSAIDASTLAGFTENMDRSTTDSINTKSKRYVTLLNNTMIRQFLGDTDESSVKLEEETRDPNEHGIDKQHNERAEKLQNRIAFAVLSMLDRLTSELEKLFLHSCVPYFLKDSRAQEVIAPTEILPLSELLDLYFLILQRSSFIPELCTTVTTENIPGLIRRTCFVLHLLWSVQRYIGVTQRKLFNGPNGITDQARLKAHLGILVKIMAHTHDVDVRRAGATLLLIIFYTCYESCGAFYSIESALLSIFYDSLRLPSAQQNPESFRSIIWECKDCYENESYAISIRHPFRLYFAEFMDSLTNQIELYFRLQDALEMGATITTDYEALEEELYAMAKTIPMSSMLDAKLLWLHFLELIHLARKNYTEAANCRYHAVEHRIIFEQCSEIPYSNEILSDLEMAAKHAEKGGWVCKTIEIYERMLPHLRRVPESCSKYDEVLTDLKRLNQSFVHNDPSCEGAYYRVLVLRVMQRDDATNHSQSKDATPVEYIYKRNKFTPLTDFIMEIRAVLQEEVKAYNNAKVEIVQESKVLPSQLPDDTVYARVCAVESLSNENTKFQYATPFTRTGSAYGNIRGQMKKITYLTVHTAFPCIFSRQKVIERHESSSYHLVSQRKKFTK